MANRRLSAIPAQAPGRPRPPSKARWAAAHPTIGVNIDRPAYERLDARRRAEGKTWAELFLGALAERDAELAASRADGFTEGRAAAQEAVESALTGIRREHRAAMANAAQEAEAAAVAAYERGRAEADPAAVDALRQWQGAGAALWEWRSQMESLVDRVLARLDESEADPWMAENHRRYVAVVHELRDAVDHKLELELRRVSAARR
ncbi:MAG: hypothetical protein ACYCS9_08165 [Candidatus Dormibacteria bacterium]